MRESLAEARAAKEANVAAAVNLILAILLLLLLLLLLFDVSKRKVLKAVPKKLMKGLCEGVSNRPEEKNKFSLEKADTGAALANGRYLDRPGQNMYVLEMSDTDSRSRDVRKSGSPRYKEWTRQQRVLERYLNE